MNKDSYWLAMAFMASKLATCDRASVGCVIINPKGHIVSTGYNGAPSGMKSCNETGHKLVNGHCLRVLHAEVNAIQQAKFYYGENLTGCTAYVTMTPCSRCMELLLCHGIKRIITGFEYNNKDNSYSKELLESWGATCTYKPPPILVLIESEMNLTIEDYKEEQRKLERIGLCL